jgi:hypothetical protein
MTGDIIERQAALSIVQVLLDRPADELRALTLEGEAGIGKSTLWQAGVVSARMDLPVIASRPAEAERSYKLAQAWTSIPAEVPRDRDFCGLSVGRDVGEVGSGRPRLPGDLATCMTWIPIGRRSGQPLRNGFSRHSARVPLA